jgi:hypothetical protein
MEPKDLLMRSQQSTAGLYPELNVSILRAQGLYLKTSFNIILPSINAFQAVHFFRLFDQNLM